MRGTAGLSCRTMMINTPLRQIFPLRTAALACWLLFLPTLAAQTPVYFPLEVGNTWLYRAVSINANPPGGLSFAYQSIQVRRTEKIGDREYFDVSYFGRDVALRMEPSTGEIFQYDKAAGTETLWVSLNLPVGSTFPTSINPCPTQGQIASRDGMISVAGGDFPVVTVKYQGSCADVGATTQYYASNVGLLIDEETTFGGRLTYRLLYYKVGNTTGSEPEVSFTVSADRPQYFAGTVLTARLTLRSSAFEAVNLHYTSGQAFDFQIFNDRGDIVYTWSRDKTFLQAVHDEKLVAGELTYGVTAPLEGLPPGKYIARGFLTTDPIVYLAQVPFEIMALPGNR